MTNYDPRLELARRLANSRKTNTPLNLGTKINVPTTGITDPKTRDLYNQVSDRKLSITQQNPNLAEQVKAIGGGSSSSLGRLGRNLLGVVTTIDTPRRAVISTVREVTDVLDTDPKTKGSLSDWAKQTKDPTYGFGTAFPMKGNWGRFVGFVGDVGLDPLTYLTAGAAGTTTFGTRVALYNTLRAKGISAQVAGEFLQRGKTALTKAGVTGEQLAEMGLKRSGMYMFGSKLRVPLSGPVAEGILSGISRAKVGFTGTRFGEVLQKGFMGTGKNQEEWIRAFRLALARNEPLPLNLLKGAESIAGMPARDVAVNFLNANTAREAATNIAKKEFAVRSGIKLNEIGLENIEPYRKTVYQVMEGTRVASDAAEQKLANDLSALYSDIWKEVQGRSAQVDPSFSRQMKEEYFPWVISDDGRSATANLETPWVKDLMTVLEPNPLDLQGSFKSRTLQEGNKWFWTMENGVKTDYILKADDLNITRLNEISRGAIGVDFWKTDAAEVLGTHYIDSASKHMGLLALFEDLNKSGIARKTLREAGMYSDMVQAQAASMGLMVQERTVVMAEAADAISTAMREVNGRLPGAVKNLEGVVAKTEKELAESAVAASRAGLVNVIPDEFQGYWNIFKQELAKNADMGAAVRAVEAEMERVTGLQNIFDLKKRFFDTFEKTPEWQLIRDDIPVLTGQVRGANVRTVEGGLEGWRSRVANFGRPVAEVSLVGPTTREVTVSAASMAAAKKQLSNAKRKLTNLRSQYDTIFESDMPQLAIVTNEMLDRQISNIDDLEIAIKLWQDEVDALSRSQSATRGQATKTKNALGATAVETMEQQAKVNARLNEVNDLAASVMADFDDAIRVHEEFVELSNILSTSMEKIIDGKRIKGVDAKRLKSIIGGTGTGESSIETFAKDTGAVKQWIGENIDGLDFFKEIQSSAGVANVITKEGVRSMTLSEVYDVVARAGIDINSTLDTINAAAFVVARDIKFYGDAVPAALVSLRNDLMEMVKIQANKVGFAQRARMGDQIVKPPVDILDAEQRISELYKTINKNQDLLDQLEKRWEFRDIVLEQNQIEPFDMEIDFEDYLRDNRSLFGLDILDDQAFVDSWITQPEGTTLAQIMDLTDDNFERFTSQIDKATQESDKLWGQYGDRIVNLRSQKAMKDANGRPMTFSRQDLEGLTYTTQENAQELTDRLAAYTLTSEVERRFSALGMELSAMGYQVPTEGMHAAIMRKVAGEHLEAVSIRQNTVTTAYNKLSSIQEEYENILFASRKADYVGENPQEALNRLFEEAYTSEPEAMNSVFGSIIKFHSDVQGYENRLKSFGAKRRAEYIEPVNAFFESTPALKQMVLEVGLTKVDVDVVGREARIKKIVLDRLVDEDFDPAILNVSDQQVQAIRQRARELLSFDRQTRAQKTEFVKDQLRPWFNEVQPYARYTQSQAKKALKVFAPLNDEYSIRRFFVDQLGGTRRSRAANSLSTGQTSLQVIPGALNVELSNIRARSRYIYNVLDPQADVNKFLMNPFGLDTGPFSYLQSLENLSKTLDGQIKRISGLESVKNIVTDEKQAAKLAASLKGAQDVIAELQPTARNAARSSQMVAIPESQQKAAAAARKMIAKHDRLVGTPEYAIAVHDQQMTDTLSRLAVVDGYTINDLRSGEAGWVISPKPSKIKLGDYGVDDTIANTYFKIEDAAGEYTVDSYLISPDGNRLINVDQSAEALRAKRTMIQVEIKRLMKIDSENPAIDKLNEEFNALNIQKWRHVTVKKVQNASEEVEVSNVFKLSTVQTPIDKLEGDALTNSILFGGVTGEQSAQNVADVISAVRIATENKFATFMDPNAAAVRRQTADYLFANDVIDDQMRQMFNSNKPISDVLNDLIKMPDGSSTSLNDIILNSGVGGESEIIFRLTGLEGRLSFGEDEWGALFTKPFSEGEALRARNRIRSLESQLKKFRKAAEDGRSLIDENGARVGVAKRTREIEAEIADLNLQLKTRNKATQGAALVKFQQLFDQFDSARISAQNELAKYRGYADEGLEKVTVDTPRGPKSINVATRLAELERASTRVKSLNDTVDNFVVSRGGTTTSGENISSRRQGLKSAWESSPSSKVIAEVEAINASPEMQFYQAQRNTASGLATTKNAVDKQIKLRRGNLSYTEKELVDSAQQIINTVKEFDGGDFSTVAPLLDSLRNAFVINAESVVESVKYDGLSKQIPKATKNLIAEIQASFPEKLPLFTVDLERIKQLEDAVSVARFNVFESTFLVAKETLHAKDALSPYNQQIATLRQRLITLNEKEAAQFAQQEVLVKRIADALGISKETRETIQREWIDGYGVNKLTGAPSKSKRATKVPGIIPAAEQRVVEAQALYDYISTEYKSILPRFQSADDVATVVELEIKPKIVEMERLIKQKKDFGRTGKDNIRFERKTSKYRGVTTVKEPNIAEFETWLKEAVDTLNIASMDPNDPLHAVLAEATRAQVALSNAMLRENTLATLNKFQLAKSFDANIINQINKRTDDAYMTLEKMGFGGLEVPQEIYNMFGELRRFKDPAFSRGFGQFIDNYTKFFKRYATLSPGFHVRNAMTNTFALLAAGADLRTFPTGLRLYREMEAALKAGTTLDNWIKSIANPVERARVEIASRSMFAAGGGQTEEQIGKFLIRNSLEDNAPVRASRLVGGKVENSARFMLGYDSAVKGLDFNVATARTKRYLFDYEDIGQVDRAMKQIIPFWMFASRALPLHLTNMIVNPKPYQIYRSFERNFEVKEKIDLTPDWVELVGGFKITNGTYLMPDLGFNKIPETLGQLSDPARLINNLNPALRVPLEYATNKQFQYNRDFSDKPIDVSGAGAANFLLPLLELLGKAGTNAEGKQVADEKTLYALSGLIPTIGQAERALPSGPDGKSNFLAYLGVPLRGQTEKMKQGSLYEALDKLNKLNNSQGM